MTPESKVIEAQRDLKQKMITQGPVMTIQSTTVIGKITDGRYMGFVRNPCMRGLAG